MDALVLLILLLPLTAAVLIGGGYLFALLDSEKNTAAIANWAIRLSCLLALLMLGVSLFAKSANEFNAGYWLTSDSFTVSLNFITTDFSLGLAALLAGLLTVFGYFSRHYLTDVSTVHRFFFIFSLFAFAVLLLVLSANAVGTLIGWQLAALCVYCLVATGGYAQSTSMLVIHTLSAASFMIAIGLSYAWTGSLNWQEFNLAVADLPATQVTGLALFFTLATLAKSAQLPFTPWSVRIIEQANPVNALCATLLLHAGVYLLCVLQALFERSLLVMVILAIVGLLTAVYSALVGLVQTDRQSTLAYAISAHIGLLFLECGLGFWQLAKWHAGIHLLVRSYQLLNSATSKTKSSSVSKLAEKIAAVPLLHHWAVQGFYVEHSAEITLVRPIQHLAHDLCYLDDEIINHGFVLRPRRTQVAHCYRREFGRFANDVERLMLRPRYLVLFVFLTLLAVF